AGGFRGIFENVGKKEEGMSVTVQFLGAAGTVTGSKYLVEGAGKKLLVDAGLFQGNREWRERNWEDFPVRLSEIDGVLLTHAHIDHTGILPRLVKLGLRCPVWCTDATHDLSKVLLPDSAHLQEEETEWRKKKGRSRHENPQPLYTMEDASEALRHFRSVSFDDTHEVLPGVSARWTRMGHILGAASIRLEIGGKVITFSGDVGRYHIPILRDPQPVSYGDLLLVESTYGNRLHDDNSPEKKIAHVIRETEKRGGVLVIPSFAVGRAQLLLYYIRELKEQKKIPNIPVIIDSPMASEATEIYKNHPKDYDEQALGILSEGRHPFSPEKLYFTRDREESKRLNSIDEPMIIISASGMLSGGRILHHLFHRVSSPQNTILFVGYQPPGGRGDWMLKGSTTMRIFGEEIDIRAHVDSVSGLSAHGDREELMRWCTSGEGTPKKVAVVHGEPESAEAFRDTLKSQLKWDAFVAEYRQKVEV
ncbi:MAG: MBL fold metallo-hydrolase, partial [Bdellovibrionales bacterium]|nr:MBL fold metallo-hydrolase [Bdellovibrionales bacterium]